MRASLRVALVAPVARYEPDLGRQCPLSRVGEKAARRPFAQCSGGVRDGSRAL